MSVSDIRYITLLYIATQSGLDLEGYRNVDNQLTDCKYNFASSYQVIHISNYGYLIKNHKAIAILYTKQKLTIINSAFSYRAIGGLRLEVAL